MTASENQIVVYQPDDTTRLSVRFDGETVWLSQEQMIALFQRDRSVISRHIANAFKEDEVDKENCLHVLQTNAKELFVIDAYPGVATLEMFAKRGRVVTIELVDLRSQIVISKIDVKEAA